MAPENTNEEELRRREEELRIKEQEIRLRELEMELNKTEQHHSIQSDPPLQKTVKHEEPRRKKGWLRKIPKLLKFGLLALVTLVVTVVVWRLSSLLMYMAVAGAIAFVGYKLYLEGDDD